MTPTITIDIPADFDHVAAVFNPTRIMSSPTPPLEYGIIMPGDVLPAKYALWARYSERRNTHIVGAKSVKAPLVYYGEDNSADAQDAFERLKWKADRWSIPYNVLLRGRPLRVAVTPYEGVNHTEMRPMRGLTLNAVQVLGDLTKSEALDARIAEIRGWFA